MTKQDIVKLNDEHQQPIRLYEYLGFWFWEFVNWPDDEEQEPNGGFNSRQEAIVDAQAYCDEAAIG